MTNAFIGLSEGRRSEVIIRDCRTRTTPVRLHILIVNGLYI